MFFEVDSMFGAFTRALDLVDGRPCSTPWFEPAVARAAAPGDLHDDVEHAALLLTVATQG